MIIIFDLWGTLGTKNASFSTALRKHFGLTFTTRTYEEILQLRPWYSYEEMAEHFLQEFKIPTIEANISFIVKAQKEAIELATPFDMIRHILSRLQEKHTLALLSNSTIFEAQVIQKWGFDEFFSAKIFPFEIGSIKPDKEIYLALCDNLGVLPKDCLFVDDSAKNCEAASRLGMKSHQYKGIADFELFLREKKLLE